MSPRLGPLVVGVCLWLASALPVAAQAPPAGWQQALTLALQGGGPRDAGQATALRSLLDQSQAQRAESAEWACLDLWLRAEWEDDPDLPAARADFLRRFPCSECQTAADWWSARWVLRRVGPEAAAPRLLRLAAAQPASAWSRRAEELLTRVDRESLTDSTRRHLLETAAPAEKAWWTTLLESRRVRGRLLLVAPLSGADASLGQALRLGTEAALDLARVGGSPWELTVWDCQSDPLLAREQLLLSGGQPVDAVLLPGLPTYLAAVSGLELPRPVLALGYEGPHPATLNPRLFQFGLDPGSLGALAAELARDSLRAGHAISLGPATRASMRAVDGFEARWKHGADPVEWGQKQWYFFGARHMERQLENLRLFEGGRTDPGVWLVLGSSREGAPLAEVLAQAPAGVRVLGDAGLLEALSGHVPATLAGRLLILADWLPEDVAFLAGAPGREPWERFRGQVQARQGRGPGALESRAFEAVRLLLLAGDRARHSGQGVEEEVRQLREPSLFGSRTGLRDGQAEAPLLLGWTGREYRVLGRPRAGERKP